MKKVILNEWSGILDYNRSHKQLLLRDERKIGDEEFENFDILFEGVFYLEMPTVSSKVIALYEGNEDDKKYIEERYFEKIHWYGGATAFILEINRKKYYIGANSFVINTNNLMPWQTSIIGPKQ